jgi:hypothetical protein
MTQKTGFARAKPPTSLLVAEPVAIGGPLDDVDPIREKIRPGRALLRVVVYPWGVELAVCEVEGGP